MAWCLIKHRENCSYNLSCYSMFIESSASRSCLSTLGGRIPRYPFDCWLGGPQSRSGHGDGERISLPVSVAEPLSSSLVTVNLIISESTGNKNSPTVTHTCRKI
jgi:hypothetical protein